MGLKEKATVDWGRLLNEGLYDLSPPPPRGATALREPRRSS